MVYWVSLTGFWFSIVFHSTQGTESEMEPINLYTSAPDFSRRQLQLGLGTSQTLWATALNYCQASTAIRDSLIASHKFALSHVEVNPRKAFQGSTGPVRSLSWNC